MKTASTQRPLAGPALLKETCRRIRVARSYWDAHNNRACRGERDKALALYETMSEAERDKIPQELRVWLRYRSEKYFGADRTPAARTRAVIRPSVKEKLHPRNRFRAGYDFPKLVASSPPLAAFVAPNVYGQASIDYADPECGEGAQPGAAEERVRHHGLGRAAWLPLSAHPRAERLPALPGRPARIRAPGCAKSPSPGRGARYRHGRELHLSADRCQ